MDNIMALATENIEKLREYIHEGYNETDFSFEYENVGFSIEYIAAAIKEEYITEMNISNPELEPFFSYTINDPLMWIKLYFTKN
jgi:hypothetical protein